MDRQQSYMPFIKTAFSSEISSVPLQLNLSLRDERDRFCHWDVCISSHVFLVYFACIFIYHMGSLGLFKMYMASLCNQKMPMNKKQQSGKFLAVNMIKS